MSKKQITAAAVARIQKATVLSNGGLTPKGSFAAKAQSVLAKKGK